MVRLVACVAVGVLSLVPTAWAGEKVEYKDATLIRQEDHGVMVFDTKEGEIKATPSPGMKAVDLDGKVYMSSFVAAEKHEHAIMALKVGNLFNVTINKATPKTFYIDEARLVKGEFLKWGDGNKIEKADAAKTDDKKGKTTEETKPDEKKPAAKEGKHAYSKATIKSYEKKNVTFKAKAGEITAELSDSFKAVDNHGALLKNDDRFRVFKEGNVVSITTMKTGDEEVITFVRLTKGDLADKTDK